MNKNYKLLTVVAIIIVIIIAVILAIIFAAKKKSGGATLTQVPVSEKVFYPHLASDGQFLYYFGDHGARLKKFDFAGQETEELYPDDILFTTQVFWSPDDSKVIIFNNDSLAKSPVRLFQIEKGQFQDLDKNIKNVIWSADSEKIYYQFYDQENNLNYLASANFDGSHEVKLLDLQYLNYGLVWLDNYQKIGYWSKPTEVGGTKFWLFDLKTKESQAVFSDYRLGDALSSPKGDYLAYSRFDQTKSIFTISLALFNGEKNYDSVVTGTVNNAVWSSDEKFLIAAANVSGENDSLYRIEAPSAKSAEIKYQFKGTDKVSAENLMLSPDNKTLYFISNDILYQLAIN